jgi:hypothetical protein
MSHPALGLPVIDSKRADPRGAARLRAARPASAARALAAALDRDSTLRHRYDEAMLRRFLQDEASHLETIARAIESGRDAAAATYADTIVPPMRRRGVPMRDLATLLRGAGDAAFGVLGVEGAARVERIVGRMVAVLDRPAHVAGDRPRGRVASLLWKAAGFAGW